MQDVQSVLDVAKLGGASANQCERCDGMVQRKEGTVQYDGGVLQYVTWHPSHGWVVQDRLCDCAIGVAMAKRDGHGDTPRIADARWFDVQRDTAMVYLYRRWEIEHSTDRWSYYRTVLEKVGTRRVGVDIGAGRKMTIDEELALIPADHWGDDWWNGPPQQKWQNPAWQEGLGVL